MYDFFIIKTFRFKYQVVVSVSPLLFFPFTRDFGRNLDKKREGKKVLLNNLVLKNCTFSDRKSSFVVSRFLVCGIFYFFLFL
jgi:hypothetical protein